jgi:hypothetical protein
MTRDSDIDEIHNIIDKLMRQNNIEVIDFILKYVSLQSWGQSIDSLDLALSFLVSTLPVKNKLKNRSRFIQFIEQRAPIDEVEGLLVGLI